MPDTPASAAPTELSYQDALRLAMRAHREGFLDDAELLYRRLHEAMPSDPNPTHYLGVLLHQRGRSDEGLELIRRSIDADPSVASWHNNLGNLLLDTGKLKDAANAYHQCTRLDPENSEVLNNLGVLLRTLKLYEDAEVTLKKAIEKNPTFASAHTNLASLYYELKRIPEGHEHIALVLASQPGNPVARKMLGLLYASMGRLDSAAQIFRDWLKHEPDSEQAKHHLAAVTRQATPDRAANGYVEEVFDAFAGSFDSKLAALDYCAPRLVGEAVARVLGNPAPRFRILDAGCGTGLCGPYLTPYAERLVGVDLSANMLERARSRGQYAELTKADLVAYLENEYASQDLVVSADTLCYFGRLDSAVNAARRALRAGGHLIFTVESHDEETDFKLNPNGRYSHRASYVERVLRDAGFVDAELSHVNLRNEGGRPVAGWLTIARSPG